MLKKTYLLWLFGLALLSPNLPAQTDCDNVTQIPTAECDALLALYDSTNGEGWTDNNKWLTNNKPCGWFGVRCEDGHVVWLFLEYNQLSGSLPTGLDALSELKGFELQNNQLNGIIPPDLGNLANLESLYLYSNQLSGAIPPELGNLDKLEYLRLHDNELCGDIPVELMNLTNIVGLSLDDNHLTPPDDPIFRTWLKALNPGWEDSQTPCLGSSTLQFKKAKYSVDEDGVSVEITVERVYASDGAISVECVSSDGSATAGNDYSAVFETLNWGDGDASDKTFTVDIINDDEPENNETFIVSLANPIGGAQIGSPDTATVTIKDDDKSFNCKKTTGISTKDCQALVALYDSTDGENWENNTGWKTTNKPCNWNGVACQKKRVTGLTLWNNNLKGSIPKDFFKLKKLENLALSNNDLNGTSLNKFKKLKNLDILLIDNCKLSGKIPNSLMKLKKLTIFNLKDNCLKTKVSSGLKEWLDDLNPGWDETQGTDCLY